MRKIYPITSVVLLCFCLISLSTNGEKNAKLSKSKQVAPPIGSTTIEIVNHTYSTINVHIDVWYTVGPNSTLITGSTSTSPGSFSVTLTGAAVSGYHISDNQGHYGSAIIPFTVTLYGPASPYMLTIDI